MNYPLLKVVSFIACAATLAPSLLYFAGSIGLDAVKTTALIGTIAWFAVTPLWMGRIVDQHELHPGAEPTDEI
jgi:hypothetical protein